MIPFIPFLRKGGPFVSLVSAVYLLALNFASVQASEQWSAAPGLVSGVTNPPYEINVRVLAPPAIPEDMETRRPMPFLTPDSMEFERTKQELRQGLPGYRFDVVEDLSPQGVAPELSQQLLPLNFDGLDYGNNSIGLSPPDPTVAVGPNHIVEMVNVTGRIWNKTGGLVSTFALDSFFKIPSGFSSTDPQVIYDSISGRFFATFTAFSSTASVVSLAVSQTDDPTGSWFVYPFNRSDCSDFPHLGVSDDKVIFTFNAFGTGCTNTYLGAVYYILNKSELLSGSSTVNSVSSNPDKAYFTVLPATSLTNTTTHFMATAGGGTTSTLTLFSVTGVPGVSPVNVNTTNLNIRTKAIPPDAQQLGTTTLINTGDARLLIATWRAGSLWVSANEACTPSGDTVSRSCLRLIEVLTGTPSIRQDMTSGLAGAYYYYPGATTDGAANLHVVFSRSSSVEYAGVRVSGRISGAPLNTLQPSKQVQQGLASHLSGRWGDYFAASVDPSDPSKVWVVGEYAKSSQAGGWFWGTRIAQVSFGQRDLIDFDGDRKTDIAVYRTNNGGWYIIPSSTDVPYGIGWGGGASDKPVPGDYDGDGRTDIAVYRPSTGAWYIIPSSTPSAPNGVSWGLLGDIPVPKDYDGDGKTDIAVYRPSTGAWYVYPSGGSTPYGIGWGGDPSDRPVPGDYDGDGKTDIAVYRTSTGAWYVYPSGGSAPYGLGWGGGSSDKPVPGDYDGDGKTDIAVYRASNGGWYIYPSGGGSPYGVGWGGDVSDIPLAASPTG